MKLLILSDLHLEFEHGLPAPTVEFDAVILAGDIHAPGHKVVEWARRAQTFGDDVPVIVVLGNHEYYRSCLQTERDEMRRLAGATNVHILDRDVLVLDDARGGKVRLLGCTLWTDFELPVVEGSSTRRDPVRAMEVANRKLNDFRLIEVEFSGSDNGAANSRRLLAAEDTLDLHLEDRAWLQRQLVETFEGVTVVVTHHGPSADSVPARFRDNWLSPAFVSHLPDAFFGPGVDLWIHGHTHHSVNYHRNGTRVLSNPRGYRMPHGHFENPDFDGELVVEIATG